MIERLGIYAGGKSNWQTVERSVTDTHGPPVLGLIQVGHLSEPAFVADLPSVAFDHNVDRLADDHANARALARGLSQINGIEVQQPETNLVFFKPDGAGVSGEKMVAALRPRGVLLAMMDGRIRACTHLDVTADMIEDMVGLVREIVRGA